MDEFIGGLIAGAFFATCLVGLAWIQYDDKLCSGNPSVELTKDTIRTFSCVVELKTKEKK